MMGSTCVLYVSLFFAIFSLNPSTLVQERVKETNRKSRDETGYMDWPLATYCYGKRSYSRVSYYNNSTATFRLLLRSRDVEENLGRQNNKKLKAPHCIECKKPVAKNHKRAICTECFDIMHAKCTQFLNLKAVSSTVLC